MFNKLIRSRRFWIAVVAVAVNLASAALPGAQYKAAIDAFNQFAMLLIAAYTVEDSASGFGRGK